ncbi:MAG TPA: LuxR C-terminal-related transcriptional regulator [Cyclobacteriaceae bacterium]|nr:LuxR C-terminal-related transcriptional regulator [Cyclobacteriaceae bacterium]
MLQENLLSKIPSADLQKVNDALKTISITLEPYLGTLTRNEYMDFLRFESSNEPLVQEFLYYALTDKLIFKSSKQSLTRKVCPISPSELRILNYLRSGLTSKEIAFKLNLSLHTVKTHRKNMFEKTGVQNVVELLNFAEEHNLI